MKKTNSALTSSAENILKGKKVIVTGGAGFIGSHVADALLARGAKVHIIDNLSAGKKKNIPKGATFHKKDIRNLKSIEPIFKGASYIFHLAAVPSVPYSIDFPAKTFEHNVLGTLNVLEAARKAKASRVVFSASSAAYGDQPKMPLTEDMPALPKSPYALQKYEGELMCKLYSEIYSLSTASLRYFNAFGPRLDPEGAYALVIGRFLKQRKEGKPMTITGNGKQTRDFTHVYDIARANILAAVCPKNLKGEVFNIGSGKNMSIRKVAELVGGSIEFVPARLEVKDSLADNSKARKILGWKPEVSVKEGIGELKKIFNL